MIFKSDKNKERLQRARRTMDIHGTAVRPRISVYKSNAEIYAQLINDDTGETIIAVSTLNKDIAKLVEGKSKSEAATIVGLELGKRAKSKKIELAVFDRSGYRYTGRVKNIADGAREGGLKF